MFISDTVIGEYTGELITTKEYSVKVSIIAGTGASNYFFNTCMNNLVIDATAMGNHTRFN